MRGKPNYAVIHRSGQEPMETRKIVAFMRLKSNMVSLRTGGGRGWGNPLGKYVDRVRWDVLNESITPEHASKINRVIINPKTLEVNPEKTKTKGEGRRSRA